MGGLGLGHGPGSGDLPNVGQINDLIGKTNNQQDDKMSDN